MSVVRSGSDLGVSFGASSSGSASGGGMGSGCVTAGQEARGPPLRLSSLGGPRQHVQQQQQLWQQQEEQLRQNGVYQYLYSGQQSPILPHGYGYGIAGSQSDAQLQWSGYPELATPAHVMGTSGVALQYSRSSDRGYHSRSAVLGATDAHRTRAQLDALNLQHHTSPSAGVFHAPDTWRRTGRTVPAMEEIASAERHESVAASQRVDHRNSNFRNTEPGPVFPVPFADHLVARMSEYSAGMVQSNMPFMPQQDRFRGVEMRSSPGAVFEDTNSVPVGTNGMSTHVDGNGQFIPSPFNSVSPLTGATSIASLAQRATTAQSPVQGGRGVDHGRLQRPQDSPSNYLRSDAIIASPVSRHGAAGDQRQPAPSSPGFVEPESVPSREEDGFQDNVFALRHLHAAVDDFLKNDLINTAQRDQILERLRSRVTCSSSPLVTSTASSEGRARSSSSTEPISSTVQDVARHGERHDDSVSSTGTSSTAGLLPEPAFDTAHQVEVQDGGSCAGDESSTDNGPSEMDWGNQLEPEDALNSAVLSVTGVEGEQSSNYQDFHERERGAVAQPSFENIGDEMSTATLGRSASLANPSGSGGMGRRSRPPLDDAPSGIHPVSLQVGRTDDSAESPHNHDPPFDHQLHHRFSRLQDAEHMPETSAGQAYPASTDSSEASAGTRADLVDADLALVESTSRPPNITQSTSGAGISAGLALSANQTLMNQDESDDELMEMRVHVRLAVSESLSSFLAPQSRRFASAARYQDGIIILGGVQWHNYQPISACAQMYRTSDRTWRPLGSGACPVRHHHAACVIGDTLVMTGGIEPSNNDGSTNCVMDVYTFDLLEGHQAEWRKVTPGCSRREDLPALFSGHCLTCMDKLGVCVLFGGSNAYQLADQTHVTYNNGVYLLIPPESRMAQESRQWEWRCLDHAQMRIGLAETSDFATDELELDHRAPSPRSGHSMTYFPEYSNRPERILLFGGQGGYQDVPQPLNDLWVLCWDRDQSAANHVWVWDNMSGRVDGREPQPRTKHAATRCDTMLIICGGIVGGITAPQNLEHDIHVLETQCWHWATVTVTSMVSNPQRLLNLNLFGHTMMCLDDQQCYIFGGGSEESTIVASVRQLQHDDGEFSSAYVVRHLTGPQLKTCQAQVLTILL